MINWIYREIKNSNTDFFAITSIIFGVIFIIGLTLSIMAHNWPVPIVYVLGWLLFFFLSSGVDYSYDVSYYCTEQKARNSTLLVSFIWPAVLIYFALLFVWKFLTCLFKALGSIHQKSATFTTTISSQLKSLYSLVRISSKTIEDEEPVDQGAYRTIPKKCKTCGHLFSDPIHK